MSEATTPIAGQVATMTLRTAATTILKLVAGALIAHGYMKASGAEAFIGIGMVALTYVYSFWCEYGSIVAKAALDILRAKVLEAAAKARSQGVVPSAALASVAAHVQATTPAGGPAGAAEKSVINGVLALFAVLVALSFAMPATAAPKQPRAPACALDILKLVPGCKQADGSIFSPATVWKNIQAAFAPDLVYAKAMADAAGTAVSKLRSACYAVVIVANAQVNPTNLKDANGNVLTAPSAPNNLITLAEGAAEILDDLQPISPVIVGCAPAANALNVNAMTLVNAIATGAAAKIFTGGLAL